MQKIELVVTANTWEDAKTILAQVRIYEKRRSSYRPINGLFIVAVKLEKSLDAQIYALIKEHDCVAILSDSDSLERAKEILDHVYKVETQLRKLLLHVSDSIEIYFDVLYQASEYTRNFTNTKKNITSKGKLDPITSHLTFGEMIEILTYDLSWSERQMSGNDVFAMLDGADDYKSFKETLRARIKPQCVWDVIASNVLKTKLSWEELLKDLVGLKKKRDKAAHHQVITDKERAETVKKAKAVLKKITPTRELTPQELAVLKRNADQLSSLLRSYPFETIGNIAKQQAEIGARIAQLTLPSSELLLTIQNLSNPGQTIARALRNIRGYPFLFDEHNTDPDDEDVDDKDKKDKPDDTDEDNDKDAESKNE